MQGRVRTRKRGGGRLLASDVGIDLGTATVIVFVRGRGIVLREPSIVAIDQETREFLAVGEAAREMVGRTPGHIVAVRPMRNGVVANYQVTELMLRYFIRKALGSRSWLRPRLVACVPSAVTDVEQRAVVEACREAGAREVHLLSEPMAAAIGAGIPVEEPRGHMVVDVGGGTTDVAVISMGREVVSDSVRVAGDHMDEAIARYLRRHKSLIVGERTAEEVKLRVGTVDPQEEGEGSVTEVRGRDAVSGLPRTVTLSAREAAEALLEPAQAILEAIQRVLERTPPELAADIFEQGMVMTGGGSLLRGLDRLIARRTGLPVYVADDPITCVARGTGRVLETLDHRPPALALALARRFA